MSQITFAEAINYAFIDSMKADSKVICMGLGVTDPKGVFGTTLNLEKLFGKERVFDIPTSENALTGVCVGLSLDGYRPILNHQRLDFALLSLDQIINNAAKIHYMFGGKLNCPIVLRMIIGRGWGQGPTHSQNLQQIFAGIPGLKVVMPGNPQDAYSLLRASISSSDPIIFLEHRWLHNMKGNVDFNFEKNDIKKQKVIDNGRDFLIVASSFMLPEAIRAKDSIEKNYNLKGTILNFRIYDKNILKELLEISKSIKNVLIIDTANEGLSIAHLIYYKISNLGFDINKDILTMPDNPEPTSYYLTRNFYINSINIIDKLQNLLNKDLSSAKNEINPARHHDVPGDWFKGPF